MYMNYFELFSSPLGAVSLSRQYLVSSREMFFLPKTDCIFLTSFQTYWGWFTVQLDASEYQILYEATIYHTVTG